MSNNWYIKINDVEHGPLSPEKLKQLAQQGKVTSETPLKKEQTGTWLKAGQLNGLFPPATKAEREPKIEGLKNVSAQAAELRTWTDTSGKFSVEAKFGSVTGDQVHVIKPDGNSMRISLAKLSEADQAWIKNRMPKGNAVPKPTIATGTDKVQPSSVDAKASPNLASSPPIPKPRAAVSDKPTSPSQARIGFWAFCVQDFATTRSFEAYGICLGLLAIPFISLLKPVLGFGGLCFVLAGAASLSIMSGLLYLFWCLIAYYKRGSSDRGWTFMAPLAYGGLMFLVPMTPWIVAEYFTPRHGLLATIVPYFQKDQAKWFGLPANKDKAESSSADLKPSDALSSDKKTFVVKFRHPNHKTQETAEVLASSEEDATHIVKKQHPGVGVMSVMPKQP